MLLKELSELSKDQELLNEMDAQFYSDIAKGIWNVIANDASGAVAETAAVALIFGIGYVYDFYSQVFHNGKEFVAHLIRIQKMKDPEKQYAAMKEFSDEVEKMVDQAISDKKIHADVRKKLKKVKEDMFGKVKRMSGYIEDYKKYAGRDYPGTAYNQKGDERVKELIAKWTKELKDLSGKVKEIISDAPKAS